MNPTPRQLQILRYVHGYTEYQRYAPTQDEIAGALGISKPTVFEHLYTMRDRGVIDFERFKARSIKVTKQGIKELGSATSESSCCPTCGRELTERTNGTGRTPNASLRAKAG